MASLFDRAGMSTTTTGTGTLTLGTALGNVVPNLAGFLSFAGAGVPDGTDVSYLILDANNSWEVGHGTYTASGTTLSRNVTKSSNANSAINLSGSAQVFITLRAEDMCAAPDGSVAAPGFYFNKDTATGLYRIGASEIGIALGGTKYVDISTSSVVFSQTTDASSTSTGALQSAGGLGVAKRANIGDTVAVTAAWSAFTNGTLDGAGSGVTIGASGNVAIPNSLVGLFVICEVAQTGGALALVMTGAGIATIVAQTNAGFYTIGSSPAAGHVGINNNGSNVTTIYNGFTAASVQIRMVFLRLG